MKFTRQSGFTMIEVLLVVAIIGGLFLISTPVLTRLQTSSDLQSAQQALVADLRRAQQLARASNNDQQWGVKIQTGSITVFMGATYAGRDTTYDEVYETSTSITNSGINELVFSKTTALPSTTGNIDLTNNNTTRTTSINAKGTISY